VASAAHNVILLRAKGIAVIVGAGPAPWRLGHRLPKRDFNHKLAAKQLKAGRAAGALRLGPAATPDGCDANSRQGKGGMPEPLKVLANLSGSAHAGQWMHRPDQRHENL
jgi:hypothetical protein